MRPFHVTYDSCLRLIPISTPRRVLRRHVTWCTSNGRRSYTHRIAPYSTAATTPSTSSFETTSPSSLPYRSSPALRLHQLQMRTVELVPLAESKAYELIESRPDIPINIMPQASFEDETQVTYTYNAGIVGTVACFGTCMTVRNTLYCYVMCFPAYGMDPSITSRFLGMYPN